MGESYAYLGLKNTPEGIQLVYSTCERADKGTAETEKYISKLSDGQLYLRVQIKAGAICNFAYSINGVQFTIINETFKATPGRWIGAKVGLFCTRAQQTNDSGYTDFDWFKIEPNARIV
jgi:hypothetical protein